jgi:hypothetical protein
MNWLFDTITGFWHLWQNVPVNDGDTAFCGHVKDSHCSPDDGGTGATKCQDCVAAYIRSLTP